MMNKLGLLTVGLVLIIGAGIIFTRKSSKAPGNNSITKESNQANNSVRLVRPAEFDQLKQREGVFVVDVHTPEQTHIPGTDAFIPFDTISNNPKELPADKDTPILVYCRSGSMSAQASQDLVALGYTNVSDLEGGIKAYKMVFSTVDIEPSQFDFGEVIYGEVAKTTFSLTNFTSQPLSITRISTSCGCTSASAENENLAPYESTTINVSFDPAIHKDSTDLGEVTRVIYVDTNNPNYSQLTAEILANVTKP